MSWYCIHRIATYINQMDRFPESDPDEYYRIDLKKYITTLHELELKSHHVAQLKDYVQILPERKRNIIERLRQIGWRYFVPCREIMLGTFEEWKNKHQIFDSSEWALHMWDEYTIEYDTDQEAIEGIMRNDGISISDPSWGIKVDAEDIASLIDVNDVKNYISNQFWNDYYSYETQIEEFLNENYEEQYEESGQEAIEFMEEHDLEEKVLEYIMRDIDFETYITDYEEFILIEKWDILTAIKNILYPKYMDYFGNQIEEVYENIDRAVNRLNAVQEDDGISGMTVAISLSLNVMHVFGNILTDYGDNNLDKKYLDWLANDTNEIAGQWEQEAHDEFIVGRNPVPVTPVETEVDDSIV